MSSEVIIVDLVLRKMENKRVILQAHLFLGCRPRQFLGGGLILIHQALFSAPLCFSYIPLDPYISRAFLLS